MYGEQGEVTGPGTGKWEGRLAMMFPNNKEHRLLPMWWMAKLYYHRYSQTFDGDNRVHGEQGEVIGPGTSWAGCG